MFKRVPGTRDILPDQIPLWHSLEATSRRIFSLYNYQEIRSPLIENSSLFDRSLGESAEIVQKQMFLIPSGDETYALRPEATAPIVRAYIENNLDKVSGVSKLYYIGPMFRRERPQKGRLRQFHHIGCEAIGTFAPAMDVEMISLADALLKAYAIRGYTLKVNSLGCAQDKAELNRSLREGLQEKQEGLCPDCQVRFQKNVLRILDCKQERCRKLVDSLGLKESFRCDACEGHLEEVKKGLRNLGVAYSLAPHLVRGLDYYTRTVFEISHPELGSQQDALGAGGRYDTLVSELGGPALGAIGFALGVERLLLVNASASSDTRSELVYCIGLGEDAKQETARIVASLRAAGIVCDTDYENKSLKGAMRRAGDLGARFVAIIGDNELQKKTVMLKDMAAGTQQELPAERLQEALRK